MKYTKNYYHVLGLATPSLGSSRIVSPEEIKKAYRSALLVAHPDKAGAGGKQEEGYTVDDVKEAFRVLGGEGKAEYDRWLAVSGHGGMRGSGSTNDFILGLEVLDLDDFDTVPVSSLVSATSASTPTSTSSGEEGAEEVEWVRSCRCGAGKGFRIREVELEDAERRGEKEVLVGCEGCSLWVRVGFDVEEG